MILYWKNDSCFVCLQTTVRFSNKVAASKLIEMYLKLTVIFGHQHSISWQWSVAKFLVEKKSKWPKVTYCQNSAVVTLLNVRRAGADQHGSYWKQLRRQPHHRAVFNDDCRLLGLKASCSSINAWALKSETVLTTGTMATAAKQRAVSPQGAWVHCLKRLPVPPHSLLAILTHRKGKSPSYRSRFLSCDKALSMN